MGALDGGLDLARAIPYPYGQARLLHLRGLLHGARGEPELAHDHLEAVQAIVGQLGADVSRAWTSDREAAKGWASPPIASGMPTER